MPSEVLATVLYAGKPLVEIMDDGTFKTKLAGVHASRIGAEYLDVENKIGARLQEARQLIQVAQVNPYRDVLQSTWKTVMDEIPREDRNGLSIRDVGTVMNALNRIAKRDTQ
jgi:hypothetical protein